MKPDAELRNSRGQVVRVLETAGDPQKIAVFYPGLGYGPSAPLFFALGNALEDRGWTVLAVDYRYNENLEFLAAPDGEKEAWFREDSLVIGRWVADRVSGTPRVVYAAKSLGTSMLLNQAKAGVIPPEADLVWLTPGTSAAEQFTLLPTIPQRSFLSYGTSDRHFLGAASTRPAPGPRLALLEIPGAGHSFEVAGDHRRSLANVADVVDGVLAFLGERL